MVPRDLSLPNTFPARQSLLILSPTPICAGIYQGYNSPGIDIQEGLGRNLLCFHPLLCRAEQSTACPSVREVIFQKILLEDAV